MKLKCEAIRGDEAEFSYADRSRPERKWFWPKTFDVLVSGLCTGMRPGDECEFALIADDAGEKCTRVESMHGGKQVSFFKKGGTPFIWSDDDALEAIAGRKYMVKFENANA